MALQGSGVISLNDIHIEAGGTTATSASINDTDIRGLISKTAGAAMSFSEWYGASSLITLAAQGSATASRGLGNTSISLTTPTFTAGDIAIVFVRVYADTATANELPTISAGPSGFTELSTSLHRSNAYSNKGGSGSRGIVMASYYKVLVAGDTTISTSFSYCNDAQMTCQVYRPSDAVSTITNNDVLTTSSNTIATATSVLSVIAYGASSAYSTGGGSVPTPTHTWGAGPTYNQGIADLRAGSYMQDGTTPADVTWSSNGASPLFLSGYLEIS
jgi:hypothetical protein|tara:strand:+ start:622 stop:1443 length:822 start_codon:yes stop_codon:yes gene_type:complete